MNDRDNPAGTLTGLTREEAKEFHSLFVASTGAFVGLTLVAHTLIWLWRPWF